MKKSRYPDKKAVTLVEILLSLVILTMVTAAISSGTNYLIRRMVRARNAAVARNLAWKRLAEVKSSAIKPGRQAGVFGHDFPGYRYSEKIVLARVGNKPIRGLYNYDLSVVWPEAWQEETLTFSTFIADNVYKISDGMGEEKQDE